MASFVVVVGMLMAVVRGYANEPPQMVQIEDSSQATESQGFFSAEDLANDEYDKLSFSADEPENDHEFKKTRSFRGQVTTA